MNSIFQYNGNPITFEVANGGAMVNATEMAKSFNRQPYEFLRLPSTERFIEAYEATGKSRRSDIIKQINGVGTWMHEDVALEFARWLSPEFAIWCNDRIKELLKHGATALRPEDLLNPDFIIKLATALKEERAEKEKFRLQNEIQSKQLRESSVKVDYYNNVLQSETAITTTVIAKELGMSAYALNDILHRNKIIFKSNKTWVLFSQYQDRGYTKTKTIHYTDSLGREKTEIHTYWTEAGREFIHRFARKMRKEVVQP